MKSRKNRTKDERGVNSVTLSLRIQPRASKNEFIVLESGGIKVRLTAPPVDGAANEALLRFLAETFAIAKSHIEIVSGHTSRDKTVRIRGVSEADALSLLKNEGK